MADTQTRALGFAQRTASRILGQLPRHCHPQRPRPEREDDPTLRGALPLYKTELPGPEFFPVGPDQGAPLGEAVLIVRLRQCVRLYKFFIKP